MDFDAYLRFVLKHHAELNLPYSFGMKLSFMGSPLVMGRALLLIDEESYEPVGTFGVVYGTGANGYEDRQVCQIEVAFIKQDQRRTSLFIRALKTLITAVAVDNPEVERIQFWISTELASKDKLYHRLASLPGAAQSLVNELTLFSVPFRELEAYCSRYAVEGLLQDSGHE